MKNTGVEYEKLTQRIFSLIVNQNRVDTIDVQQHVILQGKKNKHEIDVYWKFSDGVSEFETIIQAKDWNSKVKMEQIYALSGIINDLPGTVKGIFVSKSGYQEGAIAAAEGCGIDLYELRSPKDSDWDGYIKSILLRYYLTTPIIDNVQLLLDGDWAASNEVSLQHEQGKIPCDNPHLFSEEGASLGTLSNLIYQLCDKQSRELQVVKHLFSENTYIELQEKRHKIKGVSANIQLFTSHHETKIDASEHIEYVLADAFKKKRIKMFNKDMLR